MELQQQLLQLSQNPLLIPICVGLATLLFTVVLLYALSSSGKKGQTNKEAGGTTRTPRASKDAETPKEAETVTPKLRGRVPKTPKVEAPAEQPEPTPRRRGRPPKKAAQ
ncbi:hypothetical protein N2152v2_004768 [Parachlorella kessleri]